VIIQREPPHDKTWRTTVPPDFLVLGEYQFSIHIEPGRDSSRLTIAMGYDPPAGNSWLKRRVKDFYSVDYP
jgi:hypothetical protein